MNEQLKIAKEEAELSTKNYFDLYTKIEKKVEERTSQVKDLQKFLSVKSQELESMLDSSPAAIFYKDKKIVLAGSDLRGGNILERLSDKNMLLDVNDIENYLKKNPIYKTNFFPF